MAQIPKPPEEKPSQTERPKIARKPPQRKPERKPKPQAEPQPPLPPANEAPGTADATSAAPGGGIAGGISGGTAGGVVGGTIGGQGRTLYRADEVASPPEPIAQTIPKYPPLARARGIEGLVVVEAVVDQQGFIEASRLRVVESVSMLDEAAVDALKKWRFKPGRDRHGDAVRVLVQVPIRFRLK